MKKKLFGLVVSLLLLAVCAAPALADAMLWDVEMADYTVYVLTPDGGLNIRSGPGTSYDKLTAQPIPDYTPLHIECTYNGWGATEYNGIYGWVYLAQTVTELPDVQPDAPAEEPEQDAAEQEAAPEAAEAAETTEAAEEAEASEVSSELSQDEAEADDAADSGREGSGIIIVWLLAAILLLIVISLILLAVLTKKRRREK